MTTFDPLERAQQMAEVQRELVSHPAAGIHNRWTRCRSIVLVFRRNVDEFVQLIDKYTTNEFLAVELVQNVRPPTIREDFSAQFDQRIFNMSSSVAATVDYLRALIKKYPDSDLEREFNLRNDRVRDAQVGKFMKDFRNYLLHERLPWHGASVSFGQGENKTSARVYLASPSLLASDRWTAESREYIRVNGPKLDIRKTVEEYAAMVTGVHVWLFSQFEKLHKSEMDSYREVQERYNSIFTGRIDIG